MVHYIDGVVFAKVKDRTWTILYFWKFELLEKRSAVSFTGDEVVFAFGVFLRKHLFGYKRPYLRYKHS
jgi:hypothetical protein